MEVRLLDAHSTEDAARVLARAADDGVDGVVVAGGDGTVALALQALAGTSTPLGVVPTGTGNDFAAALGLRELDAAGAARALLSHRTRTVDLARLTRADGSTTRFATVLASGFDSKVNDRANRLVWPRGHVRYDIAVLAEFLRLGSDRYRVELELADGTVEIVEDELLMATVGNSRTYGGGIPICPDADIADGLLDAVLVHAVPRRRVLRLLPRVYRGTHPGIPEVATFRVRSIRLTAPGVTAYADGEAQGALPVRVDVEPGALQVFSG